jgi:hypothetical protein
VHGNDVQWHRLPLVDPPGVPELPGSGKSRRLQFIGSVLRRKRQAVLHICIWNVLSILFLLTWYVAGEKSNIGTFVDVLPSIVGLGYVLLSKRVKATLVS